MKRWHLVAEPADGADPYLSGHLMLVWEACGMGTRRWWSRRGAAYAAAVEQAFFRGLLEVRAVKR